MTWRFITHRFDLDKLEPGDYKLDLQIDDAPARTYTFTLR